MDHAELLALEYISSTWGGIALVFNNVLNSVKSISLFCAKTTGQMPSGEYYFLSNGMGKFKNMGQQIFTVVENYA